MLDSTQPSDGVITKPSSTSVPQTIDALRRLFADRGFTVFNVIDHSGVAGRAGVQMPDSKLVMFGKPAVGAAVMLAAPLAALDIPLKALAGLRQEHEISRWWWPDGGSLTPGRSTPPAPGRRPGSVPGTQTRVWAKGCDGRDAPARFAILRQYEPGRRRRWVLGLEPPDGAAPSGRPLS
jgi:hypothetical protein